MRVELKHLLFNVCNVCGHLYYWCPHTNAAHRQVSTEEAILAMVRTFLAAKYDPEYKIYYLEIDWRELAQEYGVTEAILDAGR